MIQTQSLGDLPSVFTSLKQPPSTLYYRGNRALLDSTKVSIVGSRRPLAYTRQIVSSLSTALAKRGVCVVSGLAMGIDALAHEAAFPHTIGVMANGLDIVYPKVNKKLHAKMQVSSLLLSEYEDGVEARPYSFVHRNRLVVALGEVLIVAQADINSGSMRSVEFALEQGKKIYVLPHRLGESDGTLALLAKDQAEMITNIDDFANQFGQVEEENDPFLAFCRRGVSYEEALAFDRAKLFEYELSGKIRIQNAQVIVL